MKKFIGIVCILVGLALLAGACVLLAQNQLEEAEAEAASANLLPQLFAQINKNAQSQSPDGESDDELIYVQPPEGASVELPDASILEMTEAEIDGYAYIGYLSIPQLNLDLPVMADWDYQRLRIAPCRYTGTVRGGDLVIMAHNYSSHFGSLSKLAEGDTITFTDMEGIMTIYEVVALDILSPYSVEEMTSGEFDLALFTCTYGGKSRVTLRCDRLDA